MQKKERNSNFELLRIIAMLMIVLSHCTYFGVVKVGQQDAYELWNAGNTLYKCIASASILGSIGVGLFFMISGYFIAHEEKASIKKVCLITLFYAFLAVLITVVLEIFGGGIQLFNSNSDLILNTVELIFVPITGSVWWFVTAYIVMILIAPTYNQFLKKLNKRGISIWILLLLVFGYTLGNLGSDFHDLEKALFFYTLGAYVRDYEDNVWNKKWVTFLMFSVIGLTLNGICQYSIFSFAIQNMANAVLFRKISSMIGHLVAEPLACFGIFCLFSRLSFCSRKINLIAQHTFGVYLFHETPALRTLIWIYLLRPYKYYGKSLYLIYILICVLIVFSAGVLIDIFRVKLFAKSLNRFADKLIVLFKKICYW